MIQVIAAKQSSNMQSGLCSHQLLNENQIICSLCHDISLFDTLQLTVSGNVKRQCQLILQGFLLQQLIDPSA